MRRFDHLFFRSPTAGSSQYPCSGTQQLVCSPDRVLVSVGIGELRTSQVYRPLSHRTLISSIQSASKTIRVVAVRNVSARPQMVSFVQLCQPLHRWHTLGIRPAFYKSPSKPRDSSVTCLFARSHPSCTSCRTTIHCRRSEKIADKPVRQTSNFC